MKLTASVEMTKADLDSLTDADLRWLENEVSRRLKERLELEFGSDSQFDAATKSCRESGPGKGICDMCAAGHYEKCRYVSDASDEQITAPRTSP